MYVDSLAFVRVKESECERFWIDSWVRQGYIMSLWLSHIYMDAVLKEVKMGMGRRGVRFLDDGKEWKLPGFVYADDLVLCGESEEDLRPMVEQCFEVCRRRGLKVNAGKNKVMLLNGEV